MIEQHEGKEKAQGLIEYALILTLVSLAAMMALSIVATPIKGLYQNVTDTLNGGPNLVVNTGDNSPADVVDNTDNQNQNDNSEEGDGGSDKQTICHVTGGKHSTSNTITVAASAVPAHLAHGDTLGPCP